MTNEEVVQRLAEITARVKATTPGEWSIYDYGNGLSGGYEIGAKHRGGVATADKEADAEFVANAKQDIPWLLERIEELEAENASLSKLRFEAMDQCWRQDERVEELEWENHNLEWSRDNAIKCEDEAAAREAIYRGISEDKDEYIDALENACKGCATCVFNDRKLETNTCLAQPGYSSDVMFACWEFDQDRYTEKGDVE